MRIDRQATLKLIVPALAAGALGTAAGAVVPLAGARAAVGWSCGAKPSGGSPDAVPPILPRMSCATLRAIRLQERFEIAESSERLSPMTRYSDTEMNVYAREARGPRRSR